LQETGGKINGKKGGGGGGGGGGGELLSSCSRTCKVPCLSTSSLLVMNYIYSST